ncbi:MAG: hypothetical protein M1818_001369 [Claussenomyces sp. TS43310]|nr:MAG: hypothetical protein M1818_001369 [Claussenomyces sp. TS43310]
MSLFGSVNTNAQSGGLFGQSTGQNQQQAQPSGGLFGSTLGQNNQQSNQNTGGLFGSGFGQNNQQPNQNQAGGGLFGSSVGQNNQQNNQQQQQNAGGLFGSSFAQNNQQQQPQSQAPGGFFGQPSQAPTSNSLFGNNQQQNQGAGLFGNSGLAAPQNQQPGSSQLFQPPPHQVNSVQSSIQTIVDKWDTGNPNCVFQHYFYNKVDESKAPYYRPGPGEDPKAWDEALKNKPGPGYIPVLCTGFVQMGERIKIQQRNLANFNQRLHEINNSLEAMLSKHDVVLSVRAMDAKRKHAVLKQRCIALATRVQVLRNRGYALGGDEEDLKAKLQALEKGICDPGLSARGEEIWARMVGLRERARMLKDEMAKRASANGAALDEETARRAEKILEDYGKQLGHLKRELAMISEELKEWEKDNAVIMNGK